MPFWVSWRADKDGDVMIQIEKLVIGSAYCYGVSLQPGPLSVRKSSATARRLLGTLPWTVSPLLPVVASVDGKGAS